MTIKPGAFRFNTDSMKLEIFRGSANYNGTASMVGIGTLAAGQWEEIQTRSPDTETGGARGLFAGGNSNTPVGDRVEWITISTTGNATDFGDLTKRRQESSGFSNRTRAIWAGDAVPGSDDTIDVLAIASGGSATDFGNLVSLTNNAQGMGGLANATRGLFAGAYNAPQGRRNTIQSVEIATTGNAITFGELSGGANSNAAAAGNATRGLIMGGTVQSGNTNVIEYITLSTSNNSSDFGDLTFADTAGGASANAVRAIYFAQDSATINYITIATLGDALDFGDLTSATNHYSGGSPSSCTRACYGGGGFPSTTDVIDSVEIMTLGNSKDFGDLTAARSLMMRGNCSNGHGGL